MFFLPEHETSRLRTIISRDPTFTGLHTRHTMEPNKPFYCDIIFLAKIIHFFNCIFLSYLCISSLEKMESKLSELKTCPARTRTLPHIIYQRELGFTDIVVNSARFS